MILTNIQAEKVEEIVDQFNIYQKSKVIFKAPTGSGKTFMIANVIDKILDKKEDKKLIFVLATISDAQLPHQLEKNFLDYKTFLNNSFEINRIASPSESDVKRKDISPSIKTIDNGLIICGLASFGKKRILSEYGAFDNFLDEIKNREDLKLIYIRDEAHRANDSDRKDKELENANEKLKKLAHFYIEMTATPKNISDYDKFIQITEDELKEDPVKLLKEKCIYNEGIDEIKGDFIENTTVLDAAINKFQKLKKDYIDIENKWGLKGINPAMLIQVEDKFQEKEEEFEENLKLIKNKLDEKGLVWAIYFSDTKTDSRSRQNISLHSLSQNHSDIDVIIFKVGPCVGWNIPRACMLVQLRNVSSESLNTQTIGRIKRNPAVNSVSIEKQNWNKNNPAYNYYIYSSNKKEVKLKDVATYKIKEKFIGEKFITGRINKKTLNVAINADYQKEILSLINEKELVKAIQDYRNEYTHSALNSEGNKYIIIESAKLGNTQKNLIKTKIENSIELSIYLSELIRKEKQSFHINDSLLNQIKDKISEINKRLYSISLNFLLFCFFTIHKNDIKDKYLEYLNKPIKQENLIELSLEDAPDSFFVEKNDAQGEDKKIMLNLFDDKYAEWSSEENLFELQSFWKDQQPKKFKKWQFTYESETERIFLRKLLQQLYRARWNKTKQLWTINPVNQQGASFEYLDNKTNMIKKSFPDYIYKINNHFLIIEVKSENDYDENKTTNMLEWYKKYTNSVSNDYQFTLVICKVKKRNKQSDFYFDGTSTINKIKEKITEYKDLKELVSDINEFSKFE